MPKYRSKPAEIEAWECVNHREWHQRFERGELPGEDGGIRLRMTTADDWPVKLWVEKSGEWCDISEGDFIVAEPDGVGYYPCKRAIFEARWEPIE